MLLHRVTRSLYPAVTVHDAVCTLKSYRSIIALHRTLRKLEKLLTVALNSVKNPWPTEIPNSAHFPEKVICFVQHSLVCEIISPSSFLYFPTLYSVSKHMRFSNVYHFNVVSLQQNAELFNPFMYSAHSMVPFPKPQSLYFCKETQASLVIIPGHLHAYIFKIFNVRV